MPGVICDVQVPTKANLEAGEPGAGVPNPDWVLGVYDLSPGGPWAFQTLESGVAVVRYVRHGGNKCKGRRGHGLQFSMTGAQSACSRQGRSEAGGTGRGRVKKNLACQAQGLLYLTLQAMKRCRRVLSRE